MTVGADFRGGAGGAAGALTHVALLAAGQADLLLTAKGGLFKGDGDGSTEGIALHGAVAPGTAAPAKAAAESASEEGAENITQVDVAEIGAAESAETAAGVIVGVNTGVAELVVTGTFLLVGEDLVGLVDLLELGLGLLIAGVEVGVVLLGQLAVGLFQLIVAGALADPQDLVKISFLFRHMITS